MIPNDFNTALLLLREVANAIPVKLKFLFGKINFVVGGSRTDRDVCVVRRMHVFARVTIRARAMVATTQIFKPCRAVVMRCRVTTRGFVTP